MKSWQIWASAAAVGMIAFLAALNADPLRWRLGALYYSAQFDQIDDPIQRATVVDVLGRRGLDVYAPLLERAARDPDPLVRIYAQQHLARRGGDNTIVAAHDALDRLACTNRFAEEHFFPLAIGDLHGYAFGEGYWEQARSCPTTAAQWSAFLADHPDLVWLNVARWHAAPVLYQAGDTDAALAVLDDALRHEVDDGFSWGVEAVLRYFVVEVAREAEIDRWLFQGGWSDQTTYALRYAKGVHAFRALRFVEAANAWESIIGWDETAPARVDVYDPRAAPRDRRVYRRGWPIERAAQARRLAAAPDLPAALVQEQLSTHRGLFEAWLFVDNDLHYALPERLAPLLTDSPRDTMLLAQAHHRELRIAHTTTGWETDRDVAHRAAAIAGYTEVARADVPYAAQAAFLAGILSREHHAVLASLELPADDPWAEHARFWADHTDYAGQTIWEYEPTELLGYPPPPLETFSGAEPLLDGDDR